MSRSTPARANAAKDLQKTSADIDRLRNVLQKATGRRNQQIVTAAKLGLSQAEIANLTGLTQGRVSQLVEGTNGNDDG